jgi:hypothetical protein
MLVSELLERLDHGENMKEICSHLNLSPTTIQRKLKNLGYTFNNSSRRWEWSKTDKEPSNPNLLELINKPVASRVKSNSSNNSSKVNTSNSEVTEGEESMNNISSIVPLPFTQDEIQSLKDIIKEWKQGSQNKEQIHDHAALYERIKTLKQEEKTRKTIVINQSIGQAFDEFTAREKVNKSDVLHLALEDFIKKYSS